MQPRQQEQQRPTPRRHRSFVIPAVLATLTLSLMLLALVLPQGAAADEKEESGGGARRAEPAATAVVVQIAAGTETGASTARERGGGDGAGQTVVILDEAIPPDPPGCPDGFVPALPPLNPALGCIANTITSGPGTSSVVVAGLDTADNPDPFCPDGWVPATPPLNPALKCINNTVGTDTASSGGSAQLVFVGSGRVEHPGHCAEGSSYRLVLRQNADGSLTWLYTCVPDGSGAGVGGPDDITSGAGGRNGVMEVSDLKVEVDVVD